MVEKKELLTALKTMISNYEKTNKDKESLKYETIDTKGKKVSKSCTLEAAYAYKYMNTYGDNILNLILVYDGWNESLQKLATNGLYRGRYDNLDLDIWVYALNINDFDLDENSMSLYKDTMIIMDKKGLFSSLEDENNSYKKLRTMI